jgi:hypothetical protein
MNRAFAWTGALGLVAAGWNMAGCAKASAQGKVGGADRQLELTVYKADFAEVRDTRQVDLTGPSTHIELRDVSKTLDPKSVMFEWPGQKGRDVTSNTYDLGVGSSEGLLKRFVGQEVELVWRSNNGSEGQRLKGTLEMADNGIVLKVGDQYYVNPDGTIIAPSGESLVTSPTLSADVQSPSTGEAKLRTSYLSRGLDWSADYVGTLAPDSDVMDLECWATVTNRSGVDYPKARITLVTGSPNVEVAEPSGSFGGGGITTGYYNREAVFLPKPRVSDAPMATGELYSYEITNPATIGQNQMNRVKMMSADSVPIVRDYSVNLAPGLGEATRQNAQLAISFKNEKSAGLGKPLPQGSVRVYESSGDRQAYIGGSTIGDVPKDDKVALTLSDSIDLYSRSGVVKAQRIEKHKYLRSYHTELYNEKKKDITLRVVYDTDETTKLISQSAPGVRKDSSTLQWKIVVPAGKHVPLDFTLQARS